MKKSSDASTDTEYSGYKHVAQNTRAGHWTSGEDEILLGLRTQLHRRPRIKDFRNLTEKLPNRSARAMQLRWNKLRLLSSSTGLSK